MIELLDYILDDDDNFWIINNITDNINKGYLVYKISDDGKYNNITKKYYTKEIDNKGIKKIPSSYKKLFKPRDFFINHKKDLTGIWADYVKCLNEIGISDDDIGIFGSYLIGFDISKDVDFIIYGKDNLYKYYKNIEYIKKRLDVTSITQEHINHQYNKHKDKFDKRCDLKEIISRNWSGIELKNGVLSTPRFIDIDNTNIPKKVGVDKIVKVKITKGLFTSMLPRSAEAEYNGTIYTIISTIWKYQSFAHKDDVIEIFANVDDDKKLIIIDDEKYYLKYIFKSNKNK